METLVASGKWLLSSKKICLLHVRLKLAKRFKANFALGVSQEGKVIMDKDIIVLLVGMLIIGLAGGFLLNFVVYQPQIQSLKNTLSSLENEVASSLAENEKNISDMNKTVSDLRSTIDNLNGTSEAESENETITTLEQLGVQAQATSNGTDFEVAFGIVNSGTADATLTSIYLYQFPIKDVPDIVSLVLNGTTYPSKTFTLSLPVGSSVGGTMLLVAGSEEGVNFQSGNVLQFLFLTANGYNYPVIVNLP
jgi:hypothetical protein